MNSKSSVTRASGNYISILSSLIYSKIFLYKICIIFIQKKIQSVSITACRFVVLYRLEEASEKFQDHYFLIL